MKHTRPEALLTRELLCFVRDQRPTIADFTSRFPSQDDQVFHVLRKYGALIVEDGRLSLSRQHLSHDELRFWWGIRVFHLDDDRVSIVCRGPDPLELARNG
jgi:hypothetical protein